MGSNSSESGARKPGGLLARLFGVNQARKPGATPNQAAADGPAGDARAAESRPVGEALPVAENAPEAASVLEAAPLADVAPVLEAEPVPEATSVAEAVPVLEAVPFLEPAGDLELSPLLLPVIPLMPVLPQAAEIAATAHGAAAGVVLAEEEDVVMAVPVLEAAEPAAPAAPQPCPICNAVRKGNQHYCDDCGWMFPADWKPEHGKVFAAADPPAAGTRVQNRYEVAELLGERNGVCRYRGTDYGASPPQPVVIVRMAIPEVAEVLPEEDPDDDPFGSLEILPSFDIGSPTPAAQAGGGPAWPSVGWEKMLLDKVQHPLMPRTVDAFVEGGYEYLIEEACVGRSLWDAWDDPEASAGQRYGYLVQLAEGLHALHQAGAICEGLRPDLVVVDDNGQARLAHLGDLLPLPLPPGTPIRASVYTPPEVILAPDKVDARADLYSFGAMLYALEYLHHEPGESDFEGQFSPKLITDRCPDVHPAFFRLVSKTFVRDPNSRFPTDEASREDASGFKELARTLYNCGRSFDRVRLDIASWTTTGMVRTGNEDAFALLHAVESRQDDLHEYAVLLLADGMGGYEAGEVAAAMAIHALRQNILQQPMFAALAGDQPPPEDQFTVDKCKELLLNALKAANKEVYTASRTPGVGKRGMGCTAEAVYVDSQHVVVGHVGDSRTYHLHQGRLKQLTRDQTFVNRMVELGKISAEEAENHPRKNELQQAIGGQPEVVPGVYSGKLERGDWVLVCSDGLTNHIPHDDLQKMLSREAISSEEAARRLLNLVNLRGATDNATVVIVRAT